MTALSFFLLACDADSVADPARPAPNRDAGRCADDPICIDVATIAPTWFGTTSELERIPDQNGDGEPDLFREAVGYIGSPFPTAVKLPDEATGALSADIDTIHFADYSDDGVVDLLTHSGLILGPLKWPINVEDTDGVDPVPTFSELSALGGWRDDLLDVTGDGRADYIAYLYDEVRVWADGVDTWGKGEPTFALVRSACLMPDVGLQEDYKFEFRRILPDIDGDGAGEMCVSPASSAGCGTPILIPATITGTIDVDKDTTLRHLTACPAPIGDQDGDGVSDVVLNDNEVHSVPIVWSDVGTAAPETHLFTLGVTGPAGRDLPGGMAADFNGDGLTDFLQAEDPTPEDPEYSPYLQHALYTGGAAGGLARGEPSLRLIHDDGSFISGKSPVLDLQDGTFLLATVPDTASVALVPLHPSQPLEATVK